MAHFLFMSIPDRGHIFPAMAVAEELARRGHRITFLTGPTLTHRVTGPGITPMAYESEFVNAPKIEGMTHGGGADMLMLTVDEGAAMLRAVEEQLSDDRPDMIAYDVATSSAGRILRRKWGLPAVQLNPIFVQNENFSFAEGYEEDGIYSGPSPEAMGAWAEKILDLTVEHGLDVSFEEIFMEPERCNLVFVPREFQIHGDTFGPEFSFVGPCVGDRSFLSAWQPPETDLPLVLVSVGTVFNTELKAFFRNAIEAFSTLPLHAVMTVADGVDVAELGPLPPNVEIHSWVSHVAVLEHAVALVGTAGMTTLMECFAAGRPSVMMPMSPLDRPTAERARELNIGRMLRPVDVTAERLRAAVVDLLGDPDTAKNAWQMREDIARAGGPVRAADVVEGFLATGVPQG